MTEAAGWVLVALVAVLIGAAVPVLLQLRKTLKAAEETLETTGRHVNQALKELSITLERVNRATDELEGGVKRISSLLTALGGIGDSLLKMRSAMGTVASLGSVLGAAILGAVGSRSRDKGKDESIEPRDPAEARREPQEEATR